MGNCVVHESQMQWGGEDWGSLLNSTQTQTQTHNHNQLTRQHPSFTSVGKLPTRKQVLPLTTATTELKVKISKKHLQQLADKINAQGLSVHQVLDQLVKLSARCETHHRSSSWRPALQSIPELN